MKYSYQNVVFLRCEACSERVHCKQCGSELSEILTENCASKAEVNTETKTINIELNMDEDEFLDYAEGIGIFI